MIPWTATVEAPEIFVVMERSALETVEAPEIFVAPETAALEAVEAPSRSSREIFVAMESIESLETVETAEEMVETVEAPEVVMAFPILPTGVVWVIRS